MQSNKLKMKEERNQIKGIDDILFSFLFCQIDEIVLSKWLENHCCIDGGSQRKFYVSAL